MLDRERSGRNLSGGGARVAGPGSRTSLSLSDLLRGKQLYLYLQPADPYSERYFSLSTALHQAAPLSGYSGGSGLITI